MTSRRLLAVACSCVLIAGCARLDTSPTPTVTQDADPTSGIHQLRVTGVDPQSTEAFAAFVERAHALCGPERDTPFTEPTRVDSQDNALVGRFQCEQVFPDDLLSLAPGGEFPLDRFPLAPGLKRVTASGAANAPNQPKETYRHLVGSLTLKAMHACDGPVSVARTLVGADRLAVGKTPTDFAKVHVVVDYRCDDNGTALATL